MPAAMGAPFLARLLREKWGFSSHYGRQRQSSRIAEDPALRPNYEGKAHPHFHNEK